MYGKEDYAVTWCDGSCSHYKTLFDAISEIKRDFEKYGTKQNI